MSRSTRRRTYTACARRSCNHPRASELIRLLVQCITLIAIVAILISAIEWPSGLSTQPQLYEPLASCKRPCCCSPNSSKPCAQRCHLCLAARRRGPNPASSVPSSAGACCLRLPSPVPLSSSALVRPPQTPHTLETANNSPSTPQALAPAFHKRTSSTSPPVRRSRTAKMSVNASRSTRFSGALNVFLGQCGGDQPR